MIWGFSEEKHDLGFLGRETDLNIRSFIYLMRISLKLNQVRSDRSDHPDQSIKSNQPDKLDQSDQADQAVKSDQKIGPIKPKITIRKHTEVTSSQPHSIEETFVKMELIEHIWNLPDTYIGSIEAHEENLWIYDEQGG